MLLKKKKKKVHMNPKANVKIVGFLENEKMGNCYWSGYMEDIV